MKRISKKQIQIIKIGQKQLGLDDGTYREMLRENFGRRSCTQLSYQQAERLIAIFIGKGFRIRPSNRRPDKKASIPRRGTNVVRIATPAELRKISVLAGLIDWSDEDAMSRWMMHKFGISKVRTASDAFLVIEGLKKAFENRMKKQHGKDWWMKDFCEPRIQDYIQIHCPARYR